MCLSDAYHKENASHKPAFLDISGKKALNHPSLTTTTIIHYLFI